MDRHRCASPTARSWARCWTATGCGPPCIWVTDDGLVVMASEAGVLNIEPARVVQRLRLQPGRMFLVDTAQGRIISDEEIKAELAAENPYADWLASEQFHLDDLPQGSLHRDAAPPCGGASTGLRIPPRGTQPAGGADGPQRFGSARPMGTDTPIAVLSARPRMLYDYFQQLFAQVTNPPLDAIREEVVTQPVGHPWPGARPAESHRRVLPSDSASATDPAQSRVGEAGQP